MAWITKRGLSKTWPHTPRSTCSAVSGPHGRGIYHRIRIVRTILILAPAPQGPGALGV